MILLENGSSTIDYSPDYDIVYPSLKEDGSNMSDFYSCGEDIKSFERNESGYIRSDIARIREEQDIAVATALMSRLQEIPSTDRNAGLTDAQILLQHRSKYCQTPSEMTKYIESQLERRDAEIRASHPESDSAIRFSESDVVTTDKE